MDATTMKKKTYIKPQMEAFEIKMQGMIALSDPDLGGGGGGGGDAPGRKEFEDFEDLLDGMDFTDFTKLGAG